MSFVLSILPFLSFLNCLSLLRKVCSRIYLEDYMVEVCIGIFVVEITSRMASWLING